MDHMSSSPGLRPFSRTLLWLYHQFNMKVFHVEGGIETDIRCDYCMLSIRMK